MIIVIEGTDGSGKETQSNLLKQNLINKNFKVLKQSFPNYDNDSSLLVKKYLNGDFGTLNEISAKQASVFFAVDRLITMQNFKNLKDNEVLLLDRYVSSNVLHQATKIPNKEERECFINWLENFEYNDLYLPKPDLTIFLDLKPELSKKLRENRELKAGTKKDIHESNEEYLINCYNIGTKIAKEKNWNIIKCFENDNIKTIDEIQNEILSLVLEKLNNK